MDTGERADELLQSWINGNRNLVIRALIIAARDDAAAGVELTARLCDWMDVGQRGDLIALLSVTGSVR